MAKTKSIIMLLRADDKRLLREIVGAGHLDCGIAHEWMAYRVAASEVARWFIGGDMWEIEPEVFDWLVEERASCIIDHKPSPKLSLEEVERVRQACAEWNRQVAIYNAEFVPLAPGEVPF